MTEGKFIKALLIGLRAALTLCAVVLAAYPLYSFEYFSQIGEIDNILGAMPIAFSIVFAGSAAVLLWMRHTKRFAAVSVAIACALLLSAALYPNAVRGDWLLSPSSAAETEAEPDLTPYAPFTGEKTAVTDDAPTLRLTGDLPVLDGATALYPVYAAFAQAVYDEDVYTPDSVLCSKTSAAYKAIIDGRADIIFTAGPSAKQMEAAEAAGANLHFTPIGKEAFVFVVGRENPTENLDYQQIRNIYSGKTAKWSTLGWKEGGDVIAFQRPEGSGSQTGLQNVMGDMPIMAPRPLPDKSLIGTNSLMQQVSVRWKGVQPALGYSYRFFAVSMYANPDAKLLKVNGVAPTPENIRSGSYPFVSEFYAVTNGEPKGNAKRLIEWILSPQGQELVEKTGYAPAASAESGSLLPHQAKN